jgi:hypothetical protein
MEYFICVHKDLPKDVAMQFANKLTKRQAYKLKREHKRTMVVYKISMVVENVQ